MAVIEVNPLVLKDVLLTLGANDYRKHVSGVTFTPTSPSLTWAGLSPAAQFSDVGSATWVASLDYVQDWTTPDSLSRYLYEHEGDTIPAKFQPSSGVGPSFEADIIIIPGAIGGQVNTFGTTTVSLGVKGRPELVEA